MEGIPPHLVADHPLMMTVIIDMADTCNPEGAQYLIIGGTPAIVSAICGIC